MVCDGQIENWLANFTNSIKETLQQQLASALGYEKLPSLIAAAACAAAAAATSMPTSPVREAGGKNMKGG